MGHWIQWFTDPRIHGSSNDPRIQGSKNPRIQGSKNPGIQGNKIQGFKDPRIQGPNHARIQGFKNPWIHRSTNPWIDLGIQGEAKDLCSFTSDSGTWQRTPNHFIIIVGLQYRKFWAWVYAKSSVSFVGHIAHYCIWVIRMSLPLIWPANSPPHNGRLPSTWMAVCLMISQAMIMSRSVALSAQTQNRMTNFSFSDAGTMCSLPDALIFVSSFLLISLPAWKGVLGRRNGTANADTVTINGPSTESRPNPRRPRLLLRIDCHFWPAVRISSPDAHAAKILCENSIPYIF